MEKMANKFWNLVTIIALGIVVYFLSKHTNFITGILVGAGPWTLAAAMALYPLLALTPVTTDPITVVIGVTHGPVIAALIAFCGNVMAAGAEYYMGYKISRVGRFDKVKKKMPFGLEKLRIDSPFFLIFGRMIPGYGSKIISLLAGSHRVPLKLYLWTSAVSSLLGSVFLAFGGYHLVRLIKFSGVLR